VRALALRDLVLVVRELQILPPPWMSKCVPSSAVAHREHSMCQPGRPGPQGESHFTCGSPAWRLPQHEVERVALAWSSTSTRSPARRSSSDLPDSLP
jgi:hypothetical protein